MLKDKIIAELNTREEALKNAAYWKEEAANHMKLARKLAQVEKQINPDFDPKAFIDEQLHIIDNTTAIAVDESDPAETKTAE